MRKRIENYLGETRYVEYLRMKNSYYLRFRKLLHIIRHRSDYVKGISYYPECEHKSKSQILKDQLHFAWKYGYVEDYYYTYGFDRKEMTRDKMKSYITPYYPFLRKLDHLNFQNPYYDDFNGRMTCRVINQEKFYFYLFLSRLGIPTPKVICFIKNKTVLYANESFNIDKSLSVKEQLQRLFTNDMDAFAKPSDGMLGKGIFKLLIKEGIIYVDGVQHSMEDLIDTVLSADYLIQERIVQHEKMSALCSSSVNTIRLQTVMDKEGNVIPFGPGVRIGRMGSSVDNWALGGVFVGIDAKTEKLKDIGILKPKYGTKVTEHPDTHIAFKGYVIPYYREAENMVVNLHKVMFRSHSIGWDIAITEKGPVIIEANDRWEISLIQAVHGGMGYLEKFFQ